MIEFLDWIEKTPGAYLAAVAAVGIIAGIYIGGAIICTTDQRGGRRHG